jgi:hypothetical protein
MGKATDADALFLGLMSLGGKPMSRDPREGGASTPHDKRRQKADLVCEQLDPRLRGDFAFELAILSKIMPL